MSRVPRGGALKDMARRALGAGAVGEAARRISGIRGRGLVLVYHRVTHPESPSGGVVAWVSPDLLRRQIEALQDAGEIVALRALLADRERHARPRFALTFDDDDVSHVEQALPILRTLDVTATFFLSGRTLHGLGPYWFELLDALIVARGVEEVGRLLGRPGDDVEGLIAACERDVLLQKIVETDSVHGVAPRLGRADIEQLAGAGMEIGFHTVQHQILTRLRGDALAAALRDGRDELEDVVGRPLRLLAYPHGKADRRTADEVRNAGYEAAWTGRPRPMHRRDDRYLLGRWEPGRLEVDDLLVGTAIRLSRGDHR
jgi:peptidoglycan/xylan/chitin deacetylase (PgdA/CDA1 family)